MVRPRDSSYHSYSLISDVLADGPPRCFEELWRLTRLHRNTLSSRLKYLVSEGLVMKTREKHRVQYALVEPIDMMRWTEISWRIWREIGKRKYLKVIREWRNTETVPGLKKLENLPENQDLLDSQELFEGFPEWKDLSPEQYYSMLKINNDLTEKAICPECFHIGTVEDHSTYEIICPICGTVITDQSVSLQRRVEAISSILNDQNDKTEGSDT
jgi:hypothetical protein